jgi:hypothetical protein
MNGWMRCKPRLHHAALTELDVNFGRLLRQRQRQWQRDVRRAACKAAPLMPAPTSMCCGWS